MLSMIVQASIAALTLCAGALAQSGASAPSAANVAYDAPYDETCADALGKMTGVTSNSILAIMKGEAFENAAETGAGYFLLDLVEEFGVAEEVMKILESQSGDGVGGYTAFLPKQAGVNPFVEFGESMTVADAYNVTVADWGKRYPDQEEAQLILSEMILAHIVEDTILYTALDALISGETAVPVPSIQGYTWQFKSSNQTEGIVIVPDPKYVEEYGFVLPEEQLGIVGDVNNAGVADACPNVVHVVFNYVVTPDVLEVSATSPAPSPTVETETGTPDSTTPSDPSDPAAPPTDGNAAPTLAQALKAVAAVACLSLLFA